MKLNINKRNYNSSKNPVVCYSCGEPNHKSTNCRNKQGRKLWCGHCKSTTHSEKACRKKRQQTNIKDTANHARTSNGNQSEHEFAFCVTKQQEFDSLLKTKHNNKSSLLVDCGATSHIVKKFFCLY